MFSRTLGGNSNYNLEKVYFWLPFERIVDENGEFFYVSLVEDGLKSTADLSEAGLLFDKIGNKFYLYQLNFMNYLLYESCYFCSVRTITLI